MDKKNSLKSNEISKASVPDPVSVVDLNCDMGEGIGNDELIMPFISSASIACGYHAGNEETIWKTIEVAKQYNVSVGAHPSFLDKKNFGRSEMDLTANEIYELVTQQLILFDEIAFEAEVETHHVKPHGALYNISAKNISVARAIANAVKDYNHRLVLFGLSGSYSVQEARSIGLRVVSEVFADRAYNDNGSLMQRSQPNALIEDDAKAIQQVMQMVRKGTVNTASGKTIPIAAETICIHGDGKHAVVFAKQIHQALKENNIAIKAR